MPVEPRTRFQRMQLALELAGVIGKTATNEVVKEVAAAIQVVLAAPAEFLTKQRLGRIEQLIHENSGNCCFRQRGYNWHCDDGIWHVAECQACKNFETWAEALQAAMQDDEFRSLKPGPPQARTAVVKKSGATHLKLDTAFASRFPSDYSFLRR